LSHPFYDTSRYTSKIGRLIFITEKGTWHEHPPCDTVLMGVRRQKSRCRTIPTRSVELGAVCHSTPLLVSPTPLSPPHPPAPPPPENTAAITNYPSTHRLCKHAPLLAHPQHAVRHPNHAPLSTPTAQEGRAVSRKRKNKREVGTRPPSSPCNLYDISLCGKDRSLSMHACRDIQR
jgi:hypothetical protein